MILSAECCLPNVRNSPSSNDCAPRLIRFTPKSRKSVAFSIDTVVGFTSRVTSLGDCPSNTLLTSFSRLHVSNALGVPPPKYTVSKHNPSFEFHHFSSEQIFSTNGTLNRLSAGTTKKLQ